ncbi:MAG: cupin domain-containing protein [Balneolaceae bacterium]|nr:cupin domain-containing protein [Balneolaceae bacterium]
MNQGHIKPAEVVNLNTLKREMDRDATYALVKTSDMEVIRMVMPAGKEIAEHSVEGEMSVQCMKGHVLFSVDGKTQELIEGDWLYLNRDQSHSLSALRNSILLVTILFTGE